MFDKLVESTKQKGGRRTGRYFAVTCAIYALALIVLGVGTVLTFSPVLAEQYSMTLPIVPLDQGRQEETPRPQRTKLRLEPVQSFVAPKKPIEIPPVDQVKSGPRIAFHEFKGTGDPLALGDLNGVPGGIRTDDAVPPPPPVTKAPPKPDPTHTPVVKQGPNKVSEGVLTGSAIRKVKPAYPQIARAIRAAGAVQVQVTISEEGNVISAVVLNGHPALKAAALEAARQWVFSPTKLSNVPVRVQGVLTFNFTLE